MPCIAGILMGAMFALHRSGWPRRGIDAPAPLKCFGRAGALLCMNRMRIVPLHDHMGDQRALVPATVACRTARHPNRTQ
jgi:hypothetical protein